jgi:hypothetical protein
MYVCMYVCSVLDIGTHCKTVLFVNMSLKNYRRYLRITGIVFDELCPCCTLTEDAVSLSDQKMSLIIGGSRHVRTFRRRASQRMRKPY